MSVVTLDAPVHQGGQTRITFSKVAGAGTTYDVYRELTQITTLSGKTPFLTGLTQNSGRLLNDDGPGSVDDGQNLTTGFIVADDGSHLDYTTKGLFVCDTPVSGTYYYCIVNSVDATVTVGTNSLTNGIVETFATYPGVVRLNYSDITTYDEAVAARLYRYYAWENSLTWYTAGWGYGGKRFNVIKPSAGISPPYPLFIRLHPSGENRWEPAHTSTLSVAHGVIIEIRDNAVGTDPYTGTTVENAKHLVQYHTPSGIYKTSCMERYIRYVQLILNNLTGDSVDFEIDPNQIYIYGASMGSAALHIAAKYPDLFAACGASVPWLDNDSWPNFYQPTITKVNSSSGPTIGNYVDLKLDAQSGIIPPMSHTVGSIDDTIDPSSYTLDIPIFEDEKQAYYCEWKNQAHIEYDPTPVHWNPNEGGGYLRYKLNEAYPVFAESTTSDAVPDFPGVFVGQRNGTLNWHSTKYSIANGLAISDTRRAFGISLSSSVTGNCLVTIRNQQNFLPAVGAVVTFLTSDAQSGTVTINSDGSVTLDEVINFTANTIIRLTITDTTTRVSFIKAA